MKERLEPHIEKLRAYLSSKSGKVAAQDLHDLGEIWYHTHKDHLDPSCGACVFRMIKQLVGWYDVN